MRGHRQAQLEDGKGGGRAGKGEHTSLPQWRVTSLARTGPSPSMRACRYSAESPECHCCQPATIFSKGQSQWRDCILPFIQYPSSTAKKSVETRCDKFKTSRIVLKIRCGIFTGGGSMPRAAPKPLPLFFSTHVPLPLCPSTPNRLKVCPRARGSARDKKSCHARRRSRYMAKNQSRCHVGPTGSYPRNGAA